MLLQYIAKNVFVIWKFFFIDEEVYCELGQNQNNINNGGFIKKEEDVIPNKKLLKLEVNSLRKKKKKKKLETKSQL